MRAARGAGWSGSRSSGLHACFSRPIWRRRRGRSMNCGTKVPVPRRRPFSMVGALEECPTMERSQQWRSACILAASLAAIAAHAGLAGFGMPAGPEPENLEAVMAGLRDPAPDFEVLLSYGTSKGASAGHVALAVAGELPDDLVVYSANFYADR